MTALNQEHEVAEKLSKPMQRVLVATPDDWFAAAQITQQMIASAGSLLTVMLSRGIVKRRSDPEVWGRSQYLVTPLGLAVRAHLKEQSAS